MFQSFVVSQVRSFCFAQAGLVSFMLLFGRTGIRGELFRFFVNIVVVFLVLFFVVFFRLLFTILLVKLFLFFFGFF